MRSPSEPPILALLLLLSPFGVACYGMIEHLSTQPVLIVVFAGVLGGLLRVQQRLQQSTSIDPLVALEAAPRS